MPCTEPGTKPTAYTKNRCKRFSLHTGSYLCTARHEPVCYKNSVTTPNPMKHLIVTLLILYCSPAIVLGMGLEVLETPGGHTICRGCASDKIHQDPILIGREDSLIHIQQFYFYRDCIVGYGGNSYPSDYYFIFNEQTEKLHYFTDKNMWQQTIDKESLRPFIHTRWFDVSYQPIPFWAIIIFVFTILPCLIVLLAILITHMIGVGVPLNFYARYALYGFVIGVAGSILTIVYRSHLQSL
jgi:hypothetical protein